MRPAFFLLVLANLTFFVWAQGYLGGQEGGREPQRLKSQLHPEKVSIGPPPPPQGCRRIDGLAAKDLERLQQTIPEEGLAISLQQGEEAPSFWVNMPGLPNKAAAEKKAAELKILGILDFHVVQADAGSFVVSLGVFRSESAANDYLLGLNRKGVKSARIDKRKGAVAPRLEVRGAADVLARRLPEWLAGAAGATAADCQ
ncbi:MAG: SPOR domain-containing protein [Rhodocyclales bacterium]|nr:SPOR domain-containing protein [Rhodocyclales bacterium]